MNVAPTANASLQSAEFAYDYSIFGIPPAPASADTLINQPPARVCHHHTFTVGVWAQPGTPWANRRYVVNVYNPSRVRVQHHAGHAPTSAWRYWHPKAWKLGYYHTIYTTWKNGVRYRTRLATHSVRC